MPPVPRRLSQDRNHLIVCGDDALAYRVVEELTANYGERVTVLLSARARGHGPRIARLPGVRVLERPDLDGAAFTDAGAQSAGRSPSSGGTTWPTSTRPSAPRMSARASGS